MRETEEELKQYHLDCMREGALHLWQKGDSSRTKNKRNATIAMARYKGYGYAQIAIGAGVSRNRARQIAEKAAEIGRRNIRAYETAASHIVNGRYMLTRELLNMKSIKKLIAYCEALK